ncbi:MAG: methyl-accepting chemotaxis protein [Plesiomonas sp.]
MQLSLKQKLLGTSLFSVIVVAAALTWVATDNLQDETKIQIRQRLYSLADAASSTVNLWENNKLAVLDYTLPYLNDPATQLIHLKQGQQSGQFDHMYIGAADGRMISSHTDWNFTGYNPTQKSWYQETLQKNGLRVSQPYKDSISGGLVITLSKPLYVNQQLFGVLGADLTLDQIAKTISEMPVGDGAEALMITRDGKIIANRNPQLIMQPTTQISPAFTQEEIDLQIRTKQISMFDINGKPSLVYLKEVPGTDWLVGLQVEQSVVESSYLQTRTELLVLSVIFTLLAALLIGWAVTYLFRDLNRVSSALSEIARGEGDLTVRIQPRTNDEVGLLAVNFNLFVERLHKIILNLRDVADSLTGQADLAAASAEERTHRIHLQQDEVTMVATAVTEMAAATQEIAGNVDATSREAHNAVNLSDMGRQQVDQSQDSIRKLAQEVGMATDVIMELNQHADNISSIMLTIRTIAEQTNLLALNAAIEAARAGEQGRGFAVVADEVRMLSQRTHVSTEEIDTMIQNLQLATRKAVDIMAQSQTLAQTSVTDADSAAVSLNQIAEAINTISDMASQIASAAEEQNSVTQEITRNTESIKEASSDLAQEANDAAQQAASLSELSLTLRQEVNRFIL